MICTCCKATFTHSDVIIVQVSGGLEGDDHFNSSSLVCIHFAASLQSQFTQPVIFFLLLPCFFLFFYSNKSLITRDAMIVRLSQRSMFYSY